MVESTTSSCCSGPGLNHEIHVRRTQFSGRCVIAYVSSLKITGLPSHTNCVCQCYDFVLYLLSDWQPVELHQDRTDVFCTYGATHDAGQRVLHSLQLFDIDFRYSIQHRGYISHKIFYQVHISMSHSKFLFNNFRRRHEIILY